MTRIRVNLISSIPVKNGKNQKPHVLTLQSMDQDNLQFDLAADSLEELYEWYQVAWEISQMEMNHLHTIKHEVSVDRVSRTETMKCRVSFIMVHF